MNTCCRINEWETHLLEELFLTSEAGRRQAEMLTDRGIVEIVELKQGIQIKSNSYVGRINLDGFPLRIDPKLRGLPLVRLLCYAYGLKNLQLYSQAEYETARLDLFDLLIYALAEYAEDLIYRKFAKGYIFRNENLSVVRGRIDIRRAAVGIGLAEAKLPCSYYKREEDIIINQVLLSGLLLAYHMASDDDLRYKLRKNIGILSETVSRLALSDRTLIAAKHAVNRLTEDYKPIIDMIELLYHMQAPQLDRDGNSISLPGYFFDMNRFFEALVSKLLKTLPEEYQVTDQYQLKSLFGYDPEDNPKSRHARAPRPDFALTRKGAVIQLYDAKYRDLWEKRLPRDMLYQLSIYAVSGIGNGKATILYPVLSDEPQLQTINLYDPMQGSTMAQVEMMPVNLKKISDMLADGSEKPIGQYMREIISIY